MDIKSLILDMQSHEVVDNNPDMCRCYKCKRSFYIHDCPTEQDGDWESGYFTVPVCPVCPDGGCVDDYFYSEDKLNKLQEKYQ